MMMDKSLRLKFDIEARQLRLVKTSHINSHPPRGDIAPAAPIAAGIIGQWVEIRGGRGETVYRRFLPNMLPLTYFQTPDQRQRVRSRSARKKRSFDLDVPAIEGRYELLLYEQSLPAPDTKKTRRQLHIKIDLSHCLEKFTSQRENVF